MSTPSPVESLAAQARTGLTESAPQPTDGSAAGEVTGSAADGLVTATLGPDLRLRSVHIEPELLRQPLVDVADAARVAINDALNAADTRPDFAPVVDLVRDVQAQARSGLGRVSVAMAEVAQNVRTDAIRTDTGRTS